MIVSACIGTYQFSTTITVAADNACVNSPGMASPLSLIPVFADATRDFFKAVKSGNKELIVEHLISAFNMPIGIASGIEQLISILFLLIAGISYTALKIQAYVLGLVFLAVELALEVSRLIRIISFNSKNHIGIAHTLLKALNSANNIREFTTQNFYDLEKFIPRGELSKFKGKADQLQQMILDKTLSRIYNHYFELSPDEVQELSIISDREALKDLATLKFQMKLDSLSRKVRPWIVKELYSYIVPFKESRFEPISIEHGTFLIDIMHEQSKKTILVHIVGLIALAIAVISIVLSFILCPPALPIVLTVIGLTLEFGRYFAPTAFLDEPTWRWNLTSCLPGGYPHRKIVGERSSEGNEMDNM